MRTPKVFKPTYVIPTLKKINKNLSQFEPFFWQISKNLFNKVDAAPHFLKKLQKI